MADSPDNNPKKNKENMFGILRASLRKKFTGGQKSKQPEMKIGNPTDFKHVKHVGLSVEGKTEIEAIVAPHNDAPKKPPRVNNFDDLGVEDKQKKCNLYMLKYKIIKDQIVNDRYELDNKQIRDFLSENSLSMTDNMDKNIKSFRDFFEIYANNIKSYPNLYSNIGKSHLLQV